MNFIMLCGLCDISLEGEIYKESEYNCVIVRWASWAGRIATQMRLSRADSLTNGHWLKMNCKEYSYEANCEVMCEKYLSGY